LDNNRASVQKQVQLFKIPNVFTPNGDGVNDLFEIEALAEFTTNELMIFNRWGNLVYEVHNYQNDWQGSNLNEGTYYYVLRVQIGPNWTTFKGYITLLRNVK
jgi:gliding motility-associated-like protein